jgi:hypothetical protein
MLDEEILNPPSREELIIIEVERLLANPIRPRKNMDGLAQWVKDSMTLEEYKHGEALRRATRTVDNILHEKKRRISIELYHQAAVKEERETFLKSSHTGRIIKQYGENYFIKIKNSEIQPMLHVAVAARFFGGIEPMSKTLSFNVKTAGYSFRAIDLK